MSDTTHNNSITRIAMPEQSLPVLLRWSGQPGRTGEFTLGNVRRLSRRDLELYQRSPNKFQKVFGPIEQDEVSRLRFTLELAQAMAKRSISKLRQAVRHVFGDEKRLAEFKAVPLMSITALFVRGLSKTRVIVWWSDVANRLVLGVLCEDSATALFMLALSEIGDIGALGKCPRCGEIFFRRKPKAKYCTPNCQAAAAMSRFRSRQRRRTGRSRRDAA